MTIRIPAKNWSRSLPNASKRFEFVRKKKKRFVSPSRASGLTTASTPSKSPKK